MLEAILYLAGMVVGLDWPDIDQSLRAILPHRSIVTHSLIVPWVVLGAWREKGVRHLLAGVSSGIAIHLAADLLSPMTGYALIHWPFPFSGALDAWPSRLWIVGNAFLGLWLACRIAGTGFMIVLPTVGAALYYSFFHEHGVLPAIVFGVLYFLAGGWWRRKA